MEFFLVKREDDLESLKLVINLARTYMDDAGTAKQHVNATKGQYLYAKAVVKVPKAAKQYPRGLLGTFSLFFFSFLVELDMSESSSNNYH